MTKTTTLEKILKQGKKAAFPKTVQPMLATLIDKPFNEPGWIYEVKWDGYRAIALMNKGNVNIISRNNKSFDEKFYPVKQALEDWGINAVVDGEIAVLNDKGIAHFGTLQNWRSEADGQLIYYVFDILWFDGKNLEELPLIDRRAIFKNILPTDATEFLEAAANLGMEGIMAKKEDSPYIQGERTRNWLKIKSNKRHEVVIG